MPSSRLRAAALLRLQMTLASRPDIKVYRFRGDFVKKVLLRIQLTTGFLCRELPFFSASDDKQWLCRQVRNQCKAQSRKELRKTYPRAQGLQLPGQTLTSPSYFVNRSLTQGPMY